MANLILAGQFATAGEERMAQELKNLPANWIVICNKTLVTNSGHSYEIDFIVIGENWVFVLDEKSWRGRITGDDQFWVRNDGSSERSPLSKADYVAKVLAGHIRKNVPGLQNETHHFVRGGVILSIASPFPQITDPRARDGVFLLSHVCQRLKQVDAIGGSYLVQRERASIQRSLYNLANRPETPAHINNVFTIEDATTVRPGVRMLQATLIHGGEPRTLMVYDLGRDPYSIEQSRKFYMREFKVLQELRSTGVVPDVKDPFPWSEDFLVVPIMPPAGKSLNTYQFVATRQGFIRELEIARDAFVALDQLKQYKIVHRALSPSAVYVLPEDQSNRVMFTNFFAARTGETSIAVSLDALGIDDPYIAPELITGYSFAGSQSDTFSLILVFLERWTATPVTKLRASVEDLVTLPDLKVCLPELPTDVIAELTEMFQSVISPRFDTPRPLPLHIAQIVGDIAQRLRVEMNVSEGKLLDNRYKVIRSLGQGAMAHTYLVLDKLTDEYFAAKHFLRTADYGQAKAEFQTLCKLSHPNLPRVYHVETPDKDIHVTMQYIPGTLLSDVEQEFPWPIERWWTFAQGLMDAVDELEKHNQLHRDIKPANIILHEDDQHPVLIDFGFATPVDMSKSAAGTPLYLPPEAYASLQPPSSTDRYATAIVLFKVLTGELPLSQAEDGFTRIVHVPPGVTDKKVKRVAEALLPALSANPNERPKTMSDLRKSLQNVILALNEPVVTLMQEEKTNPWVDKLRSLYRNSDIGNANNRGLESDFVRATYVETALDKELLPTLLDKVPRPKVVFLSGNPGDGKTAFLEQVKRELQRRGARYDVDDKSGWECSYQGHIFRSCYDASEAHGNQSADEQLTAKLLGLEGARIPDNQLTVLVAINDGRLADYFERRREQFQWLDGELRSARSQRQQAVWLIDLKQRTFVNLPGNDDLSIFQNVLESLVSEDEWDFCKECAAVNVCPIRHNALAFTRARVAERLEYLFLLTHLSQQRHITMRDLRSALAYLITANKSCHDIHDARHQEDGGVSLVNLSYWQIVFASQEQEDVLLRDFAGLDPARFPDPRLDRFLHFHRSQIDVEQRRKLFVDKSDLAPQRFLREGEWTRAMKRKLYFDSSSRPNEHTEEETTFPQIRWKLLLPYHYSELFIDVLDGRADMGDVREKIALGLLRSEDVVGSVPQGYFSIKVKELFSTEVENVEQQQLVVLKQFLTRNFTIKVQEYLSAFMIESIPSILKIEYLSGMPHLEISLDLFELLMRMAHGLRPSAPEFVPLLEDLKLFKDSMLLQETHNLVLIEDNQRVHYVTQENGNIVRQSAVERF